MYIFHRYKYALFFLFSSATRYVSEEYKNTRSPIENKPINCKENYTTEAELKSTVVESLCAVQYVHDPTCTHIYTEK